MGCSWQGEARHAMEGDANLGKPILEEEIARTSQEQLGVCVVARSALPRGVAICWGVIIRHTLQRCHVSRRQQMGTSMQIPSPED